MKTIDNVFTKILMALLLVLTIGCSSDSDEITDPAPDPDQAASTFEEVIALGADPESFPENRTEEVIEESEAKSEDYEREEEGETIEERFICTRKTIDVLDGNGKFPLFNTSAEVIYPGSLLQGKTLSDATPSPIVVKRAGGTISHNLNNGNPNSSFTVDEVKKSSIQDAMNGIIGDGSSVLPDNFSLDIIQVESENQLAIEMGIDVQTFTTKVSSDMSFSTEKQYNRTLIKLQQSFYTMSFDLPTSLEEIFDESVTPEQLSTYVQADNPATFISSVTYGRIFYMLVESTSSRQEMQAKLNVAYGAFKNKAEGEVEVEAFNSLNEVKIKVIAYGGTGSERIAGASNISEIVDRLAESNDIRAGLPLSYVVRSVERPDKIVGTTLATRYDVVDCELKGVLPPGIYSDFVDLFDDGIGALGQVTDTDLVIFNMAGDKYVWFNSNLPGVFKDGNDEPIIFDISDENAPLGAIEMDDVGAALEFRDNQLAIFNGSGFECQFLNIDPSTIPNNSLSIGPIGTYAISNTSTGSTIYLVNEIYGDSGNFDIGTDGIEAGVRVGATKGAYFGKPGNRYQVYDRTGSGSWEDPIVTEEWFGDDNIGGTQFERVGAASFYTLGGSSGRYLFVNETGDEIQEWFSFASDPDEFNGPWVIN